MNNLRRWFTLLNLHLAVTAALAVFVLVLAVKVMLAFHAAGAIGSAGYQQKEIQYAQLHARMARLQDLPQKVDQARDDEVQFTDARVAPNYSTIAQELGDIAVNDQVRLARAQYAPQAAIDGIIEVRIDAGLSGDYVPMMHFINDLERDRNHVFFIIDGVTFTGQQGGLVNIRLRLSTYLRSDASDLPPNAAGSAQNETASLNPASTEVR